MLFIRSILGTLGFYISMAYGSVGCCLVGFLPLKYIRIVAQSSCKCVFFFIKIFSGLKIEIRGKENIPNEPVIFACKHQSALETFFFPAYIPNTKFVLKKELLKIPFFGWTHMLLGSLGIDRSAGASALKETIKSCKKALKEGDNFIIFPEGTRTKIRQRKKYQPGIAMLQKQTNATVIPVAINFGLFWKRKSLIKEQGTAIIEFLPPMPKNMKSRDFMTELENKMEEKTEELIKEGIKKHPHISIK